MGLLTINLFKKDQHAELGLLLGGRSKTSKETDMSSSLASSFKVETLI